MVEKGKLITMKRTKTSPLIWIRGAGEIGSATAISLFKTGFRIIMSEITLPLAIRRSVTFSDAIIDGESSVAGINAKYIQINEFDGFSPIDFIPLFSDVPVQICALSPTVLIDARMIKSYSKDYRNWVDYVIGFGPGFSANFNCHAAIETMRGHDLGKIIFEGAAIKNTGVPGVLGGESAKRVIYSNSEGNLKWKVDFGDIVEKDQLLGTINTIHEIKSPLNGMIRGLIHPSVPMKPGLKIADVDPREEGIDFLNLSDKARSLGRAALESTMIYLTNSS